MLLSRLTSRRRAIDTADGEVEDAFPPRSVMIRLEDELDVNTLHRREGVDQLPLNAIGRVVLRMTARVTDTYGRNPAMEFLTLIDAAASATVAACTVNHVA